MRVPLSVPLCAAMAAGCAAMAPRPGPVLPHRPELADDLLADSGTTAVELVTDLDWYFSDAPGRAPAELAFGDVRARVELDRIGASSVSLCRWRKLRIRFGEAPKKRLYLTPHCNDADTAASGALQGEPQLYAQALAYRVLAALDVPAMDTRLVHVRWTDAQDRTDVRVRPAILVEDVADVARAMVGDEDAFQGPGKDGPLTDLGGFDAGEVARFHLFQLLINNRDWRAFSLRPLGRVLIGHEASPLHNVFALDPRRGRPVLIPLDLDASSFAALPRSVADVTGGADEALLERAATPDFLPEEPPLVRWMVLRVLGLRQLHAPAAVEGAVRNFLAHRAALADVVQGFLPLVPAPLRGPLEARAHAHLEAFFRAVTPPLSELPVLIDPRAPLYAEPTGDRALCTDLMRGAPLVVLERRGDRARVRWGVKVHLGDGPTRPLCPGPDGRPMEGWLDARAISAQGRRP